MTVFRPVPGKFCFDLVHNAIVRVKAYKSDSSGEHIIVRMAGSYGASIPLPLSCIRRLTDEEHAELDVRGDWW